MDGLIHCIKSEHVWLPPLPNTENLIREFDTQQGFRLPSDLKTFYRHCGGAHLFDGAYVFVPLPEVCHASLAVFGEDSDDWCPPSWYAFCDVQDGNWVGMDLSTGDELTYPILDFDHDNMADCNVIARSFTAFLAASLAAQGDYFWINAEFKPYGVAHYEPPPKAFYKSDLAFWQALGPEVGPNSCATPGCARKSIALSVMCRLHHFEMVMHRECPFPD